MIRSTSVDGPGDAEIVLDVSRLLSRVRHATPTGVDRVEMAYARGLVARAPDRLRFAAVHPTGFYGRLPQTAVLDFLDETRRLWAGEWSERKGTAARLALLRKLWTMRPGQIPAIGRARIYLQSSPHHLHNERLVRSILRRENARFVCLLHDLIPIEFPEYARPGGDLLHLRRIRTVARLADAVIANSDATRSSFLPYLRESRRDVAVHVAHLGIDLTPSADMPAPEERPYFACLGTIEPRKNHLLLLNLWRSMVEREGAAAVPRLLVIGRRGWENEQIIDMLDRCPALTGCVEELTGLSDRRVRGILTNARAVLLPSFAEGYGMPVTEALGVNVPVICSDLPALREAGGGVPDYLDPLDGPAWRDAIMDYARTGSSRRAAQLDRLRGWHAPTWHDHVSIVLDAVRSIAG